MSLQSATAAPVGRIAVHAFRIPTEQPQSDGTLVWEATTLVLVEAQAGGETGIGYTYVASAAATLISEHLAPAVQGMDAHDVTRAWERMRRSVRNLGQPGIVACAISAVDTALWDLKARLLGLPLVTLLGARRDDIPVYGSGGFTSYSVARLREQLTEWVRAGIGRVKMKVGREPDADVVRVQAARNAIGYDAELFVDANGGYGRKQALALAQSFAAAGVTWFEEPVSSDDLEGLRLLRDRVPPGMRVAAGEYGYNTYYFRRMLEAGAVDVLQADATRCGGFSGFLQVADLCEAYQLPLSTHTAPALHLHIALATPRVINVEFFHDHVRIESMLFDGFTHPDSGRLAADLSRPGIGLEFKHADAEPYRL